MRIGASCLVVVAAGVMAGPAAATPVATDSVLHIGGAEITVELAAGFDLSRAELTAWITSAATAVTAYFGRFPVPKFRIVVQPGDGAGVLSGTTWAFGGAHTRMVLGRHTTVEQLGRDWVMTHEMVHTGFPEQPDEHTWIQEGTATYIEPLARSWVGNYPPGKVWTDLVDGLPNGLPHAGDHGLDHTHTWGRTYWGGALFCLLADVEIRKRTHGQRGLVDALRAINAAGGNDQVDWSLERTFAVGDKATGVPVLAELYARLKDQPVDPDLGALWRELGISVVDGALVLDEQAPGAALRRAISTPPAAPSATSAPGAAAPTPAAAAKRP